VEIAATWRVRRGCDSPLKRDSRPRALCPDDRDRRERRFGVWVERPTAQVIGGGDFDKLAHRDDRDPVGDVLHHRQVVGDKEVRQAQLLLEIGQEVENPRLDRDVERRDRLVLLAGRPLDGPTM